MPSPVASFVSEIVKAPEKLEPAIIHALARSNGNASRNTYIARDEGWTRDQAQRLVEDAPVKKPLLYGAAIALKDCFDLEGFVTSAGSRFYAHHNPSATTDSWVAARLKVAGAVITGKTHLHQLAYGITGENRDYGNCLQPDDPSSLTGGSSSGAAASIQEGSAIAAIGTDTGGSIRAPAAFCGLAGYRASLGVGSWQGGAHLAPSFDTIGWLCRDLRDLPLLAEALFGIIPAASTEKPITVACLRGGLMDECDSSVAASMHEWEDRLRRAGVQVRSFHADFWQVAFEIYAPIQAHEAAVIHAGFYDEFEPAIADRLRWGAAIPQAELLQWKDRHQDFNRKTAAFFEQADFLMLPAVPVPRLAADADHATTRPRILRYTAPASLAGLAAVVLPAPVAGMQLLAPRGNDAALLAFAAGLST
jgi:Asp-tRNA(Asn)/Glu-tRNA(Gln) amidotransferase A subunit family amidase